MPGVSRRAVEGSSTMAICLSFGMTTHQLTGRKMADNDAIRRRFQTRRHRTPGTLLPAGRAFRARSGPSGEIRATASEPNSVSRCCRPTTTPFWSSILS